MLAIPPTTSDSLAIACFNGRASMTELMQLCVPRLGADQARSRFGSRPSLLAWQALEGRRLFARGKQ